jgi:hypothetical protein
MLFNVRVLEVRNLVLKDSATSADPYVSLCMAGVRTVYKTAVQRNTLTPVWNEEFQIPLNVMSRRILTVQLLDAKTDKVLGVAYLKNVPADDVEGSWFPLQPGSEVESGTEIHLQLKFLAPGETPVVITGAVPGFGPRCVVHVRKIAVEGVQGIREPFIAFNGPENHGKTARSSNETPNHTFDEEFQVPVPDYPRSRITFYLAGGEGSYREDYALAEIQVGMIPIGRTVTVSVDLIPFPRVELTATLHLELEIAASS